jgi:hypothetical protein
MTLSKLFRPMLAIAAIAICCSAVASAQYKFVKINIPESLSTWALGISNKNEIVGYYETGSTDSPLYHGFWRTNGRPPVLQYPIDDPSADGFTELTSIDSSRLVVGAYEPPGVTVYGLFLNGGSYFSYFVPGYNGTWANGISDSGLVVGVCAGPEPYSTAWAYTSRAGYRTFVPPGAVSAGATAANSAGEVVGWYSDGSSVHGFLRDANENFTTLDYPGALSTYLTGISDTGVIAGYYYADFYQGFLLQSGVYSTVNVPGQFNVELGQINKNGWFVGSYTTRKGKQIAFFAKPTPGASVLVDSEE